MSTIDFKNKNKIYIQSMTNTKTHDVAATINQIKQLHQNGCELVRVAIFDDDDALALSEIVSQSPIPIIADIHFNYQYALKAIDAGVFKIRLNPGNIYEQKEIDQIIEAAKSRDIWIRIGVNSGSLPTYILEKYNNNICAEAMIETLESYLLHFKKHNFNKIVISLKSSDPFLNREVNLMASKKFDFPIHLGVTEAGPINDAIIKSTISLAPLLEANIGNTIRISISSNPIDEVKVCYKLLNHLKILHNRVEIISCPTCGRLNYELFDVVNEIEAFCEDKHFPLKISILGCVVNGIGEGKHADIGLAGSSDKCLLFKNGKIIKTIDKDNAVNELKQLIEIEYKNFIEKN